MSNFYGLIGEKLGHSFSPQIHSRILNELDLKGAYNLFEVKKDNLMTAIQGLKVLGAKGVNVTIPYKIDTMKYLDDLSDEAKKIGAINTIAFNNDKLIGYNTDYHGFGSALKKSEIHIVNKKALILGTGGVSKAVVQYLVDNGISDVIYASRNPKKAEENTKNFKVLSYDDIDKLKDMDIVINCTPSGMYPKVEDSPIKKSVLNNFSTAVDLIYNPVETLFLRQAEELGLRTANGLYMLVAQAVAAQEIWQRIKIGEDVVDKIYEEIKVL